MCCDHRLDQIAMVDKYRAMLERGEEIPEKPVMAALPLSPESWDPNNPFG